MDDIKNKDIRALQSIMVIMQKVRSLEERAKWEKDRMNNITSHLSFTSRGGSVPSGLDRAFAELSDLEEQHKDEVIRYTKELKRAENIINSIEYESMRIMVFMLYVEQLPLTEVRERLNMSRRNFDAARKAIESANNMESVVWRWGC